MTQATPPRMQGQIEAPNPVELFWERNRRVIITVGAAVVVGLGANYVIQYTKQAEIDSRWGVFATATNLDEQYVSPVASIFRQDFGGMTEGLITQVKRQVAQADSAALSTAIREAADTPVEPLLIWVAAHRAVADRNWDQAETLLHDLQARFPDHPLCVETDYPVQYREEIEDESEEEPDTPPNTPDEPELEPEVPGSSVGVALAQIQKQREFVREASRFYEPIQAPEGAPRVQVTTSQGPFTIELFSERAKEHVEHFLELVDKGFYNDQNVDEIVRTTTEVSFEPPAQEFHFGLPTSKNQDQTLWDRTVPSEAIFDFNDSPGQAELSHFPGTFSAAIEAEGQSSGERYWINVNDCGGLYDGERVIVGRVVEGMDVLELIVSTPFATDADSQRGRGRPLGNIRIERIERL